MPETEDQPTEAERKDAQRSKGTTADMARALDPILYPHLNPLMQDWPRLMQITRQVRTVFVTLGWVRPEEAAAREAAARREALLEAADWIAEAHPNVRGLLCAAMDIRGFAEVDVVDMADTIARVEALASGLQEQYEASDYSETASLGEMVKAIRTALAEPERDEGSGLAVTVWDEITEGVTLYDVRANPGERDEEGGR